MAPIAPESGLLYYGDNLEVLREHVSDESIDLIYLDPPFNSKQDYNVLFSESPGVKSHAQIRAFSDTWVWDEVAEETYQDLVANAPIPVVKAIAALREFVGERSDVMAYLVMMAVRLQELHRVLKPTGSLYLHCDPTASHYLKVVLDTIFGPRNFRNEIVWKRKAGRGETNVAAIRFGVTTDLLLFYGKSSAAKLTRQYRESNPAYIASKFTHEEPNGRRYRLDNITSPSLRPNLVYEYKGHLPPRNGWAVSRKRMEEMDADGRLYIPDDPTRRIQRKRYLDELEGETVDSLWDDIPPVNSQARERLGYPTQKPVALLERIIRASSNKGETVLDPFCGCGTSIEAAEKLGRRWIGIDITSLAISLIEYRLNDAFPSPHYDVHGIPRDMVGARKLASLPDRYEFQNWALRLVRAKPAGGIPKKGADQGVDGVIHWIDDAQEKLKTGIVSVKSGHVNSAMVRDLRGTVEAHSAQMGLFVTLEKASKPMRLEAVKAGFYHSEGWGRDYPVLQILQVEDLLNGEIPNLPPARHTFKKAPEAERPSEQIPFDLLAPLRAPAKKRRGSVKRT
jgi:site-specific DNA-methyltransferase (adenine-specific)